MLGSTAQLVAALRAALPASTGTTELRAQELGQRLTEMVASSAAAWSEFAVSPERFVAHIARAVADEPELAVALDRLRAEELYLACGCADGDSAAIAALELRYATLFGQVITRCNRAGRPRDELMQRVRERLFVAADDGEPRIAQYRGIGFLENWLRVVAVRTLINAQRTRKLDEAAVDTLSRVADSADAELSFLQRHYRPVFAEALARACVGLTPEDRLHLRLGVVQELTVDRIGAVTGVHRATAARRLARARTKLVQLTRGHVAEALQLAGDELESLLRLVDTNLSVSLAGLLDAATRRPMESSE